MINAMKAREMSNNAIVGAVNTFMEDVAVYAILTAANKALFVCNIPIGNETVETENDALPAIVTTPLIEATVNQFENLGFRVTLGYFGDFYDGPEETCLVDFGYIVSWLE